MHMRGMLTVARALVGRRRTANVRSVVVVVFLMTRRDAVIVRAVAAVGVVVPMRQNHFPHAVTRAVLMGVRRRCRHDAKLRQGNRQNRRKKATHANHVQALTAVDYHRMKEADPS